MRDLYRQKYDTELKQKLERVKEKNLKTFLQDSKTYQFDKFATDLQKNIPNQNSKGITDLLDSMTKDPEGTTDLSQKAELLLLGVFKDHTWNNGSVARFAPGQMQTLATHSQFKIFISGMDVLSCCGSWSPFCPQRDTPR